MTELTIEQAFEKMYLSEIVPILKQKEKLNAKRDEISEKTDELYAKRSELYAKINELDAKRSELYAKKNELYAKINELYAKKSELNAKKNELNAKIFWKFVKFEKENDCKVNWKNWDYDFKLENLEVKSNEKKVPEEITHDGHKYKLIY
jgi:uncharacterized coiled-coil DUF342 family protein